MQNPVKQNLHELFDTVAKYEEVETTYNLPKTIDQVMHDEPKSFDVFLEHISLT